jgi:serine/threonine protein kinase
MQMKKPEAKVFLNNSLYIGVDQSGYCANFAEGALGCVVEVRNSAVPGSVKAFKLPRLLADTVRENAYIEDLMQKEVENLRTVEGNLIAARQGLLGFDLGGEGYLKGLVQSAGSLEPDAVDQDGSLILVRFEKGKPPRFCAVRPDPDDLVVFPNSPSLVADVKKCVSPAHLKELITRLRAKERRRSVVFRLRLEKSAEPTLREDLADSLRADYSLNAWYALLPSVLYDWANGSLQQTLSKRDKPPLSKWSLEKYFELLHTLATGIDELHSRELLHGDLRPANVMHTGPGTDPTTFRLIDYGSFGRGVHAQASDSGGSGATVLGPSTMPQRYSPFYAPEKRHAREFESVDAVVVSRPPDNPSEYKVWLGWRDDWKGSGDMAESVADTPTDKQRKRHGNGGTTDNDLAGSGLLPGDRVRIREYVFEVLRSTKSATGQVLTCRRPGWIVLHDRLVVLSDTDPALDTLLAVPRVTELRQVSAASDLYGIGSILLYCLFVRASEFGDERRIDRDFVEMMNTLESESYFRQAWTQLTPVCRELSNWVDKTSTEIGKRDIADELFQGVSNDRMTVYERCKEDAGFCIDTIPNMQRVYKGCEQNAALFLLVVHFALACIHRKSGVPRASLSNDPSLAPFCADRLEAPRPEGAAANCRLRLDWFIDKAIGRERFSRMTIELSDLSIAPELIDAGSPSEEAPQDALPRIQNRRLKQEVDSLKKLVDQKNVRIEDLGGSLKEKDLDLKRSRQSAEDRAHTLGHKITALEQVVTKKRQRDAEVRALIAQAGLGNTGKILSRVRKLLDDPQA